MSSTYSDSDIGVTKVISWEIRRQSSGVYTSPMFEIDGEQCTFEIDITYSHTSYYVISQVTLNFTKCSSDYHNKFIVALVFSDSSEQYIFHLLPTDLNSKKSFSAIGSRQINEPTLGNSYCSVTAVVQQLEKLAPVPVCQIFFNDMTSMLKSEIHSDFKIKAGDKIFKVHKAVIAARCAVLKKMIENDMSEKNSGQVELQADPIVVQILLDYLYTSTCKVTLVPTELFILAHFLHLDELQMNCKDYLLNNIHLKNIISILELTSYNDFNLKDLHDAAMKFVRKNEKSLMTDFEFQEFLCKNIKLETITYILRLSYSYNFDDCFKKAMDFVRTHYDKVLVQAEFKNYLISQPTLSLNILRHCLDYYNTTSDKKE